MQGDLGQGPGVGCQGLGGRIQESGFATRDSGFGPSPYTVYHLPPTVYRPTMGPGAGSRRGKIDRLCYVGYVSLASPSRNSPPGNKSDQ